MISRRDLLRSAPVATITAAAASQGQEPKRPARRPRPFRIDDRPYRRAYGRRPRLDLDRVWRFRLLGADGNLASNYAGELVVAGPLRRALRLAEYWAMWPEHPAAVIEILS